jgi:hypothetical protein
VFLDRTGSEEMGDLSKREKRRQHAIESLDAPPYAAPEMPLCHCGAPAKYEISKRSGVTFVCAKHLPEGL